MTDYRTALGKINDDEGIAATREPESYRGIALKVVRNPKGIPVLAFDCNGRVVFQSMDCDHVTLDWDRMDSLLHQLNQAVERRPTPEVEAEYAADTGELLALRCPKCHRGDIRELDRAERTNVIEVIDDVLQVAQGQADFETVNLWCGDCDIELSAPQEIFERMVWS